MSNISNNNHSNLSIDELKILEKKSRHIVYTKYKKPLMDVLRYNSMWVIVPEYIEKDLRSMLKDIRDNEIETDEIEIYNDEYETTLIWKRQKKWRKFLVDWKELFSIATSGDTYKHTGMQGIEVCKWWKESLKNWDIDEYQHINDIIRDEWHDVPEYITDDKPRFEKNDQYRQWEKEVEHEIILNDKTSTFLWELTEKEKRYLINILNYSDNSRFKIYEYLLFIDDAIEMKNNSYRYNETLSVIYEILKKNIWEINNWKIKLDNWKSKNILEFEWIKKFVKDRISEIEKLFEYLKNNTDKLESEFRFTKNWYDINDLKEWYDNFKKNFEEIKTKLSSSDC